MGWIASKLCQVSAIHLNTWWFSLHWKLPPYNRQLWSIHRQRFIKNLNAKSQKNWTVNRVQENNEQNNNGSSLIPGSESLEFDPSMEWTEDSTLFTGRDQTSAALRSFSPTLFDIQYTMYCITWRIIYGPASLGTPPPPPHGYGSA